jgi:hypothetical protein
MVKLSTVIDNIFPRTKQSNRLKNIHLNAALLTF